jgi:putative DNA primase/helicase
MELNQHWQEQLTKGNGTDALTRQIAAQRIQANFPQELQTLAQWVCWKYALKPNGVTKVPYIPYTTDKAQSDTCTTWTELEAALTAYLNPDSDFAGVGIMLSKADPYTGIDFDHCVDAQGNFDPIAATRIAEFSGGYVEYSPSGEGIHCFVRGQLPAGGHNNRKEGVEIYDTGRFFTVTGNAFSGADSSAPIANRQPAVDALLAAVWPTLYGPQAKQAKQTTASTLVGHRNGATAMGDDELREKMFKAVNGEAIRRLYNGDPSGYPSKSEADLALCSHLAFWTRNNPEQMDSMLQASGLYRDKLKRKDYRKRTIDKVIKGGGNTYQSAPKHGIELDLSAPTAKHCTDQGNADRFVAQHGENVRYVNDWGKWLIWDGTRWDVDKNLEIERLAKATVGTIYSEAGAATDQERMVLGKWARQSESREKLAAMIHMARSDEKVILTSEKLDKELYLLACTNGTLDLRTGKLAPSERSHLATKRLEIAYNANAQCPAWAQAVNDWMADAPMANFLQRAVGYSLTGDTSEQCLFFLYGEGKRGKSTFAETIKKLMGEYAQKAPTSMIMAKGNSPGIPNDIARLPGARFVLTSELEQGQRLAESLVKDLTGKDTIVARFMRAEFFEFVPSFKLWIYGNHKPVIKGTDEGIWRRMNLVPFTQEIKRKDAHLLEKLAAELPGILAWAVRGCTLWQESGLQTPDKVTEATTAYRAEMDTLGGFLADCCETGKRYDVPMTELFAVYTRWCELGNERPLTKGNFGTALTEKGFVAGNGNRNQAIRRGLKLTQAPTVFENAGILLE